MNIKNLTKQKILKQKIFKTIKKIKKHQKNLIIQKKKPKK